MLFEGGTLVRGVLASAIQATLKLKTPCTPRFQAVSEHTEGGVLDSLRRPPRTTEVCVFPLSGGCVSGAETVRKGAISTLFVPLLGDILRKTAEKSAIVPLKTGYIVQESFSPTYAKPPWRRESAHSGRDKSRS